MRRRAGALLIATLLAVARTPAQADVADPGLGGGDRIRGDEAPGLVAFTFDDGPKPGTTDRVIDALVAYDVPATFFVVGRRLRGKRAQPARDLIARMLAHDFEVGNHSFSHENLARLDAKGNAEQVDRASQAIGELTGRPVGLFRAPYGAVGKATAAHARKRRLTTVDWSIDSLDWKRPTAARMRQRVVERIFADDGGVVLLHDTKQVTADTIAQILDDLEAGNCARLAAGQAIVVPVSIHYFLRDRGTARAIPAAVEARTRRYREGLPARCRARSTSPDDG
jgi:peptidoglycan/xylan/chitin deacetylase (PgdA/CDA1 family)